MIPSTDTEEVGIPMNLFLKVMAQFLGIEPDMESRFIGRAKHFQRLGFPSGLHTGKGIPALLDQDKRIQFALALLLHENGMSPLRVIHVLERIWNEIHPITMRLSQAMKERADIAPAILRIDNRSRDSEEVECDILPVDNLKGSIESQKTAAATYIRLDLVLKDLDESMTKAQCQPKRLLDVMDVKMPNRAKGRKKTA